MGLFESTKINFILLSDLDLCICRTGYAREKVEPVFIAGHEFEFGRISCNAEHRIQICDIER